MGVLAAREGGSLCGHPWSPSTVPFLSFPASRNGLPLPLEMGRGGLTFSANEL